MPENRYYYDAAGALMMTTLKDNRRVIHHRDGEGNAVRKDDYYYQLSTSQYALTATTYSIYSTVLGKELTEVASDGTKKKTTVYGIGGVVATQNVENSSQVVRWEHQDPNNESYVESASSGILWGSLSSKAELDPLSSNLCSRKQGAFSPIWSVDVRIPSRILLYF